MDNARLLELFDAYLDQRLDDAGRTALNTALRSSPDVCRFFWERVHLHAMLGELLAEQRGRLLAEQELGLADCPLALVYPDEPATTPVDSAPRPRFRRVAGWSSLAAAAVLLAVAASWLFQPAPQVHQHDDTPATFSLARLGELQGRVQVLVGDGLQPARPGQVLLPGQEIHTGEDGFAVVTYDDDSRLELSADTTVRLLDLVPTGPKTGPGKHIFLVRGVVSGNVTRQPAGRPLLLRTEQADLLVAGTRFESANFMGETRIELEEGTAVLAPRGARAIEIRTGTYAVAAPDMDFYSAAPLVPVSGKPFAQWQESSGPVLGLAALPGRPELALACFNGLVKFWNPYERRLEGQLDAGQRRALDLVASRDGQTLAVGYEAREKKDRRYSVVLWDVNERRPRLVLPGTVRAHRLEFTPDQQSLVLATAQRGLQVRDLPPPGLPPESRERLLLGERFGRVESLAVSPDGTIAAAGYHDGAIRLWNLQTGRMDRLFQGHAGHVKTLAFQPGGQMLASGGRDGKVRLWSVVGGEELRCLPGPSKEVRCLAFSPDGQTLASGHAGIAILWSVATGEKRSTLKAHKFAITALAYLDDGRTLATAGWDRTVKLWKLQRAARVGPTQR